MVESGSALTSLSVDLVGEVSYRMYQCESVPLILGDRSLLVDNGIVLYCTIIVYSTKHRQKRTVTPPPSPLARSVNIA